MKPDEAIQADAHLRAALRHAPDAGDAAPADISAQIIAAAHRSAGQRAAPQARAPAVRGRWWLQPWGASGALATVVMAGVIGMMWRGEAPGPAREEAMPQVAQAPVPVPAPVSATTPTPATADVLATPPAPAPTTPAAAAKPRVLAAAPAVKPPTKPAAQSMAAEPSETLASARDAGAAVAAAPPAPAALAAPPPPPAAAANLHATQRAAQEQSEAAPAAVARLRASAGASVAQQPPWRTAPQPGDQFSWQPADRLQPPDAAWLARLAGLGAGRWQPLSAAPATAELAQLHWQRSGATVARFGFDRSSVWWCTPLAACERAPLDAATLRELLDQLAR